MVFLPYRLRRLHIDLGSSPQCPCIDYSFDLPLLEIETSDSSTKWFVRYNIVNPSPLAFTYTNPGTDGTIFAEDFNGNKDNYMYFGTAAQMSGSACEVIEIYAVPVGSFRDSEERREMDKGSLKKGRDVCYDMA